MVFDVLRFNLYFPISSVYCACVQEQVVTRCDVIDKYDILIFKHTLNGRLQSELLTGGNFYQKDFFFSLEQVFLFVYVWVSV